MVTLSDDDSLNLDVKISRYGQKAPKGVDFIRFSSERSNVSKPQLIDHLINLLKAQSRLMILIVIFLSPTEYIDYQHLRKFLNMAIFILIHLYLIS